MRGVEKTPTESVSLVIHINKTEKILVCEINFLDATELFCHADTDCSGTGG